jgi:hypothetical protein
MPQLTMFAQDLWTVSAPLTMMGLRLGTRMTVVRLEDGGVLLHSPVAVDDALAKEIEAIGPVKHIVAPNLCHPHHAGDASARFREAKLYAPEGLDKKRPDLRIDVKLSDEADLPFAGELEPLTIRGAELRETVFLHKRTGTVVSADLSENFHHVDHLPTRLFLKLGGVYGKPGWNRLEHRPALALGFRSRGDRPWRAPRIRGQGRGCPDVRVALIPGAPRGPLG